jgi:hypothetical protein
MGNFNNGWDTVSQLGDQVTKKPMYYTLDFEFCLM